MPKLTAAQKLIKNDEQLKRLAMQRKQILNEIKQESEQKLKAIGAKILDELKTNEQFKVDFLNLITEHKIELDFSDENN